MFGRPPTDQRAGVRPITFVLRTASGFGAPLTLKIRPEDLTATHPSRVTVNQTLGRGVQGWADNFGEGLPSVVIAGHTGWRYGNVSGMDGYQHFMSLKALVYHGYHAEKQAAIDAGRDPASVQLIFVDVLDGFAWNVVPMAFVLRRSRTRPLLIQYNITLQAISAELGAPQPLSPNGGTVLGGLAALRGVIGSMGGIGGRVADLIGEAAMAGNVGDQSGFSLFSTQAPSPSLGALPGAAASFVSLSTGVLSATADAVAASPDGSRATSSMISAAGDVARAGTTVFRTAAATPGLSAATQAGLIEVASSYNEASGILANSLRPRGTYENFDGLFGASNASQTVGGRQPSQYAGVNPFELMLAQASPVSVTSAAIGSLSAINRSDPVLAPMALAEVNRHLGIINSGLTVSAGGLAA